MFPRLFPRLLLHRPRLRHQMAARREVLPLLLRRPPFHPRSNRRHPLRLRRSLKEAGETLAQKRLVEARSLLSTHAAPPQSRHSRRAAAAAAAVRVAERVMAEVTL